MVDVISTVPAIAKKQAGDAQIGIGATPEGPFCVYYTQLSLTAPIHSKGLRSSVLVSCCRLFPGIFQNELVYDLLWDMAFRTEPIADINAWTAQYVRSRYALPDSSFDSIYAAYDILLATVYNNSIGSWGVTKAFVELTPSLQMNNSGFMPTEIWYDNGQLQSAVALMLQAADSMRTAHAVGRERYQYDVIDFTKQWMSNILIGYHAQLVDAYQQKDNTTVAVVGNTILSLMEDWDSLLNTNVHFLLGTWIRDARQWGATVEEQDWLEWNARNQVTLWGPDGEIADYASKVTSHSRHNTRCRQPVDARAY